MKEFGKALKLYLKVTLNPITAAFGLMLMAMLLVAASLSPETPDSEDYMSMIGTVGFGQLGVVALFIMGISSSRYKYFASLPFAKTLFTVVPTVCAAAAALIYDNIAITVAAFCWCEQGLSDLLVIAPINSFIICLSIACIGKPKLNILYFIPILIMATEHIVLPNISFTAHGFGLPVLTSAVIGALVFIAGVVLTLVIMNVWWKKCDHIYCGYYKISGQPD